MPAAGTLLPLVLLANHENMSAVVSELSTPEFAEVWRRSFAETPPLGHMLRHDFAGHWTRFHALPKSKRYADSGDEWAIVLHRANTLATECFGDQAQIWVVAGSPLNNSDLPVRMGMTKAMTWAEYSEEQENQSEMVFFAVAYDWKPGSLDALFAEIATDQERAVLFSEVTETGLAPYDGGFDVISLRPDKIDYLESKYRAWMSDRPDRL